MKYKHTDSFYEKQLDKYNQVAATYGLNIPIRSLDQFKAQYEMWSDMRKAKSRNVTIKPSVVETMVYNTKYPTTFRVAQSFRKALEAETGQRLTIREVQTISTAQLADRYSDLLGDYYRELKKEGKTTKEAKRFISTYFFGSL